MAFPKIDFDGPVKALTQEIDRAKQRGTYDAAAADRRVQAELDRLVTSSVAIVEQVFQVIDKQSDVAKKTMDEMEALIKKRGKKLTDFEVGVIETGVRTLERCAQTMSDTSRDSMKALLEWRGEWPNTFRKLVSDPRLVDPFIARRKKTIDDGQLKEARRTRVNEYVKRGKDLKKLAQQTATRGAALAQDEGSEIVTFRTDVQAYAKQLTDYVKTVNNSFGPILGLNAKQKLNPADQKMYTDMLAKAQLKTKEARGTLKTFTVKVATFKKSAVQFSDGNRKTAEKEYVVAAKALKQAEGNEKKIADVESKAIKHLTAIKKLK